MTLPEAFASSSSPVGSPPFSTGAASAASLHCALDGVKKDLQAIASEHNVSEVLLLVTMRDWCTRQLQSEVELGR